MYCSNCGTQNPDTAKYCQSCGSALAGASPVPPTEAAPMSPPPVVSPAATPAVWYAGFWRRFLAHIIDKLILAVPSWILSLAFGIKLFAVIFDAVQRNRLEMADVGSIIISAIWLGIALYIVQLVYYAAFESSRLQATPGKMALGIIVTDGQGRRVTFPRALGRNLGKIISGAILSIGYIMAGISEKKQALHDMLADCLVIMRPIGG